MTLFYLLPNLFFAVIDWQAVLLVVLGSALAPTIGHFVTLKSMQKQAFEQEQTRIIKQKENHDLQLQKQREELWNGMQEYLDLARKGREEAEQRAKKLEEEFKLYKEQDKKRSHENAENLKRLESNHSTQIKTLSIRLEALNSQILELQPYKQKYDQLVADHGVIVQERDHYKETLDKERLSWNVKFEEMQKQIDELNETLKTFQEKVDLLERNGHSS